MDAPRDTNAANSVDAIRARAAQLRELETKPADTRDPGFAKALGMAKAAAMGQPMPKADKPDAQDAQAPAQDANDGAQVSKAQEGAADGAQAAQAGDDGPLTWDAVAEKLGVKKKDLYDVLIPLEEGGGVKLGELKAAIGKLRTVDAARDEVEQSRHAWALKKGAEMEALEQLRSALPPLPPGAEAAFEGARKQIREAAFSDFVASAPGWEKPQYQAQRFQLWDKMFRPYGITSEQVYQEARNPQILRFIDFAATLFDRYEKAQTSAKRVEESGVRPGTGQASARDTNARPFEKNRRLEENTRVRDILRRAS
jgi:hypothetical protein